MQLEYDKHLGRGAFGHVWLATDSIGRRVAVKFFDDADPNQAEQNAIAHAKALVRVDHRAVVRVYSVERQEHPETGKDCVAIIMEYADGPSLSLHHGRLSTSHAAAIVRDLTDAVAAIHDVGLVHTDLHDANVIITPEGAKVLDILYTRSLAEVGTRTANRDRAGDLRDLAVLVRQVLQKAGVDLRDLQEAYFHATTATTRASELRDIFMPLLSPPPPAAPVPSPPQPQPSPSAALPFETDIRKMTTSDLAGLLASVDDAADHHMLWVTKSGEVRLSPLGPLTPAGFAKSHRAEMQFRWETFGQGNGYCGPGAAADGAYVSKQLADLKRDWTSGRKGYLDY